MYRIHVLTHIRSLPALPTATMRLHMHQTRRSRTYTGAGIEIYSLDKHEGPQQQLPVRPIYRSTHMRHATDAVTSPCASCHAFLASLATVPAMHSGLAALE